ncbi:putative vacuolar ATP synthase subunit G [Meira miltonrushii]|uniref:V-type proton ATPase subunit G n=1 Tax=Meira miltonrushii TaxID=1280837 RepID=A0A316VC42_9BASI|nr:putative vacuolar ATP synthase subunit G [Meira miltonrushii]PWN33823.1 putative vacuolar ATP synthase subunit G [Meira miltonrushii]
MAAQSTGIQTLLEAEKEAAKIVQKARTYRTQKLKDARSEAAKEIEELKSKQEDEFNNFKKEYEGSQSSSQSQVEKETQEKLKTINEAFDKNNAKVVEKLLERVTQTKAELHRNLQKV